MLNPSTVPDTIGAAARCPSTPNSRPNCRSRPIMLTLLGPAASARHCDGVSRRDFLRLGAVGMGGLSLAQLLALEQAQADSQPTKTGSGKRHKSLIMIFLCGGPPHQDM